jgi:Zn2+/Cd2+-exporting ATPase
VIPAVAPDVPQATAGAARRFRVEGMDCAACARTVEKSVAALDGVASARVSFGAGILVISGGTPDEKITSAVSRAGYRARPAVRRAAASPPAPFWRSDVRALSTTASVALLLVAVLASLASAPRAVAEPLYLLSMVVGGWPIARAALGALRRRSLDMNVLMALAAVGAVGIGEYAEGAWVLVLFAVGTGLEALTLERSRLSVESLMELAPAQARILVEGREELTDAGDAAPGARLVVRPGERLALDGVVVSGTSSIDQSPITGEAMPVDKQPGDEVFAGTLNVHGSLVVRATKPAEESTLSRVADLVEQAQASQAPAERFIDRFARIYTPLVFAAALALVLVPLAFGGDLDTWLYRALALLIVACPCSLVISVPVAVVSAVGGAARRGILIKGGQALEDLGRVRAVALDKTGTLTLGLPLLEDIVVLDSALDETEALALMAAVEARSEHPLAAALRRAARERGLSERSVEDFQALPGRGAQATVDGRALWAGGPRLVSERTGAPAQLDELHARGQTVIALGEGERVLALFALADRPRPEAEGLAAQLRAAGVRHVAMLTGDSEAVARAVAERSGLDGVRAGLLPADKLTAVAEIERAHGAVAMVGDGINDAPALRAARVGVTMGAAGSDVALQSADVALMSDRLDRLPEAIGLSRRALGVMRVNVIASLLVKGLFVLLAPFGLVTLVMAVAADMGMSLLVTLNALRLIRSGRDHVDSSPVADAATTTLAETAPARLTVEPGEQACADGCCASEPAVEPQSAAAGADSGGDACRSAAEPTSAPRSRAEPLALPLLPLVKAGPTSAAAPASAALVAREACCTDDGRSADDAPGERSASADACTTDSCCHDDCCS